jgi:hypothetical protein
LIISLTNFGGSASVRLQCDTTLNSTRGFCSLRSVGAVHDPDRLTGANLITQLQLGSKTNRGIHCVFDAHAPAADCRDRVTNLRGIDLVMKPERGDSTLTVSLTKGRNSPGASQTRGSPPCASILLRRHSSALPE